MSDDQVMYAAVVFGIAVFSTLMMWANSIKAKQQEAAMQACTFQTAEEAIKFVEWQKAEKVREVEKAERRKDDASLPVKLLVMRVAVIVIALTMMVVGGH